jgi:hypothetical protein
MAAPSRKEDNMDQGSDQMRIELHDSAERDLLNGFDFYERQKFVIGQDRRISKGPWVGL